jgi:CRP/FNR family transcriptional regulator
VSDTYAFSAEALEPMKVCRFSRTQLRALLEDFPAMEKRLLEVASNELVAAQEQMLLLGRKTARERFASFLITQAQLPSACLGSPVKWTDIISLPMSRSEIADYLGLSMESVSRLFTRFRNDGLIDTPDTRKIVIRDHAALGKASSASD